MIVHHLKHIKLNYILGSISNSCIRQDISVTGYSLFNPPKA